jgi:hypothetical protein
MRVLCHINYKKTTNLHIIPTLGPNHWKEEILREHTNRAYVRDLKIVCTSPLILPKYVKTVKPADFYIKFNFQNVEKENKKLSDFMDRF